METVLGTRNLPENCKVQPLPFFDGCKTAGLNIETMTADGLHLDALGSGKLIEPVVALILRQFLLQ